MGNAQGSVVGGTGGAPGEALLPRPSATGGFQLTPPWLISILITLILALGEWRYQILGGWERLGLALGLAILLEVVLGLAVRGRIPSVQSAYVSGISATLLTKPAAGVLWPVAFVAMLAIASKYALTYRGRHLWNPTNFSICAMLLIAPQSMSILGSDFGNELSTNLLIWCIGLVIVWRSKILHVTLTYLVSFAAFALLRSAITGVDPLIEIAPVTGPMYQLFSFFMVTDPRTTVHTRGGRILVTVLVAALECVIRLGNDFGVGAFEVFQPAPSMYALTIVGPAAMFLDLWRQGRRGQA
jgi:hypothetical protein